jgi:precorrin-3B C17-methyltransferase
MKNGTLTITGTGPGAIEHITPKALDAIRKADTVAGYKTYMELISDLLRPEQEILSTSMMQEVERCRAALDAAEQGKNVVIVCSGDPGIYAMAGLVFELAASRESRVEIRVVPGIPALSSCAAILGAPLMHDFAVISLSDLLTPWEVIEKRLEAAAMADFVTVLYNPKSKRRTTQIERAQEIMLRHRRPDTPSGIVTGATRENEQVTLTTLEKLTFHHITMQSTVIIGNSSTFTWHNNMITPRGYNRKYEIGSV